VTGDVYFGRNVTLRGTVIVVANEGQRIDIPDGCILENRLLSGNLTMTVRAHCRVMRPNSRTPFSFRICDWIVLYRGPYFFFIAILDSLRCEYTPGPDHALRLFLTTSTYSYLHGKDPHFFSLSFTVDDVSLSFGFFFFFFSYQV
jgi:hypothetical protein